MMFKSLGVHLWVINDVSNYLIEPLMALDEYRCKGNDMQKSLLYG